MQRKQYDVPDQMLLADMRFECPRAARSELDDWD